jgi:hypothetical protein
VSSQQIIDLTTIVCTTVTALLAYLGHVKNGQAIQALGEQHTDLRAALTQTHSIAVGTARATGVAPGNPGYAVDPGAK